MKITVTRITKEPKFVFKTKYELAVEMLEWATEKGFPKCTVLADSWFGIGPFVKELRRPELSYVVEIKNSYSIRTPCKSPRLTKTGRVAKRQYDLTNIAEFFTHILSVVRCGFAPDRETGKKEKVLYQVRITTARLNSIPGKHRIIQSYDPARETVKYLITNELTWEPTRILSVYGCRWVIEEFFRNARQLSDTEGVTVRSGQGVTTTLCLIFWTDFLLHYENYKQGTAGELPKESLTIPSIVRRAQYENLEAFADRVRNAEEFFRRWPETEKKRTDRKRKIRKELIEIEENRIRKKIQRHDAIVRRIQYENLEAFAGRIRNDEEFFGRWPETDKKRTDRRRKIRKELTEIEENRNSEKNSAA